MTIKDARAMVAQFIPTVADHSVAVKREAIAQHMVVTNTNFVHASWELYGRPKGKSCPCTPCLTAPRLQLVYQTRRGTSVAKCLTVDATVVKLTKMRRPARVLTAAGNEVGAVEVSNGPDRRARWSWWLDTVVFKENRSAT